MEKNKLFKLAFAAGIIVLLGGNALVFLRASKMEWRNYQTMYFAKVAEKTNDKKLKAEFLSRTPRIDQQIIRGFGEERVDRCTTCHAAISDPRFKDAKNPLKTHPALSGKHPFNKFGCTICHDGNGRGVTVLDAHGKMKHWEEPMLNKPYIEGNCVKCHPYPYLKETPVLKFGRKLFMTKACYTCHKIEGLSKGNLGVELTVTGAKWPIEYLIESIVKPKANNIESIMPKMDLTKGEITALAVFLKSLRGVNLKESNVAHYVNVKEWNNKDLRRNVPVSVASGKEVFRSKSCNACHTINGVGGKIGPDLSVVGLQRTKKWIIQHHIDPRSVVAGSIMPNMIYSKSELEALALFLGSQKKLTVDNGKVYKEVKK